MTDPIPYAILNSDGQCINRILWDGDESIWQPPNGCSAVADPQNIYPIHQEPQPPADVDPLQTLTLEQKQALVALLLQAAE